MTTSMNDGEGSSATGKQQRTVKQQQPGSSINVNQQQRDLHSSGTRMGVPLETLHNRHTANLPYAEYKSFKLRLMKIAFGIIVVLGILILGVLYFAAIDIMSYSGHPDSATLTTLHVLLGFSCIVLGLSCVFGATMGLVSDSGTSCMVNSDLHSSGAQMEVQLRTFHNWQTALANMSYGDYKSFKLRLVKITFGIILVLGILIPGVLYFAAIGIVRSCFNPSFATLIWIQFFLGIFSIAFGWLCVLLATEGFVSSGGTSYRDIVTDCFL